MEYSKILRRAWDTVWQYKALWLFGAIIALTAGASATPGAPRGTAQGVRWEMEPWRGVNAQAVPAIISVAVAVGIVLLVLGITAAVFRYVAETSLIGMVDEYEESGEKRSVESGLRLGWSRPAWRLFLLDLVVGIPVGLVILLILAVVAAPALLWLTGSEVAGGIGTLFTVILFIPGILLIVLVAVVISVLMRFFRRACVIEGLGVGASLRRGFAVARGDWGSVGVTWLIVLGLGIAWAIVRIVVFVVLLPLFVLTIIAGAVVGGVPTLIALGIATLAAQPPPHWIPYLATAGVGLAIGLPLFIVVAGAPWFFVNGLGEVFFSSIWTQVYRELAARKGAESETSEQPVQVAEPEASEGEDGK